MNKWILIHTYNNLVEDGKANALRCDDDNQLLIPMIDADEDSDDPVLWCPSCDTIRRPGINVWDQISAVVKEHHDI